MRKQLPRRRQTRPLFESLEPKLLLDAALPAAELRPPAEQVPVPPPVLVDLDAADDSGWSDSDNITNVPTVTIDVEVAETPDSVRLYVDGAPAGEDFEAPYTFEITLTEDEQTVTARSVTGGEESTDSPPLAITLDTAGPTVVDHDPLSALNLRLEPGGEFGSVAVTFDGEIHFVAGGGGSFWTDDVLMLDPLDAPIPATGIDSIDDVTFDISFADQSAEGAYDVTVGPDIEDLAGNPMAAAYTWSFGAYDADVVFTQYTHIGIGNTAYRDKDLVVLGCLVDIDGSHQFESLRIFSHDGTAGQVSHTAGELAGMDLTLTEELVVGPGSEVTADGKGYYLSGTPGPGAGTQRSGGGHGGWGGAGATGAPGVPYDELYDPDQPGSRGGGTYGGAGGGLIHITSPVIVLDGPITADGYNAGNYSGGGSGGSIRLDVGTLVAPGGSAEITANGGDRGHDAAGGAGGRIAVYYAESSGFPTANYSVAGGGRYNDNHQDGGAGTVYLEDTIAKAAPGLLIVDNNGRTLAAETPLLVGENPYVFSNIEVREKARLRIGPTIDVTLEAAQWVIGDGGVVLLEGEVDSSDPSVPGGEDFTKVRATGSAELYVLGPEVLSTPTLEMLTGGRVVLQDASDLDAEVAEVRYQGTLVLNDAEWFDEVHVYAEGTITSDVAPAPEYNPIPLEFSTTLLTVDAGGKITADGRGYHDSANAGPGAGMARGGGAHGGDGGDAEGGQLGGIAYDSIADPSDFGSRGGGSTGGAGGGLIHITADVVEVDGEITADGSTAGNYTGGGSGGSIRLDVGMLSSPAGTGQITANGGNGGYDAAGGAGGRIAVYYAESSGFPTANYSVAGGGRYNDNHQDGGAGTVYLEDTTAKAAPGLLIVDNNGRTLAAETPLLDGENPYVFSNIEVREKARLRIGPTIDVTLEAADWVVGEGGEVLLEGAIHSSDAAVPSGEDFRKVRITGDGKLTVLGPEVLSTPTLEMLNGGQVVLQDALALDAEAAEVRYQGTLVLNDSEWFDEVHVYAEGTITSDVAPAPEYNPIPLELSTTLLTVDSGGKITADGRGYHNSANAGPGPGTGRGGGAHGGDGGDGQAGELGGIAYDSIAEPSDFGSRGGGTSGGAGGGLIHVTADVVTLDGEITADGYNAGNYSGGGSGGSIRLDVGMLSSPAGLGQITANGGNAGYDAAGGAGGRIAVYYAESSGFPTANYSVAGGGRYNDNHQDGGAGTVYLDDTTAKAAPGLLIVDNNGRTLAAETPLLVGENPYVFSNIEVREKARLRIGPTIGVTLEAAQWAIGDEGVVLLEGEVHSSDPSVPGGEDFTKVRVTGGGELTVLGPSVLSTPVVEMLTDGRIVVNDSPAFDAENAAVRWNGTLVLNVPKSFDDVHVYAGGTVTSDALDDPIALGLYAVTLTVDAGGEITVTGSGYRSSGNPGPGVGGSAGQGGGAGHGGVGGASQNGTPGGIAYDSETDPADFGSRGGHNGGAGGGLIRIIADVLELDGAITANGNGGGNYVGGGSGGSIRVDAWTLTSPGGTGQIRANGGSGGYQGGGGAGGRIAIYAGTIEGLPEGNVTSSGASGSYGGQRGEDGTVYYGTHSPGGVTGSKWNDLDGDGVRDAAEPPLEAWTIFADFDVDGRQAPCEPVGATDAYGNYWLANVSPGTWEVTEVAQDGWAQTYPRQVGPEFQVNTWTDDEQYGPAVAMAQDGPFVVVWESYEQDASGDGIYGQRYDADGNAVGGEFRVNTETEGDQEGAAVAMDADGAFVVVWQSNEQDGSDYGVFGQRYDADGNPVGGEFQVNTETEDDQERPAVAMSDDGRFVVVWESYEQDGSADGIYGQRYDADGNPAGTEFRANTHTISSQGSPAVAMSDDGAFVVVWDSYDQDGDDLGIYGQRYDADGNPAGTEFRANTYTNSSQASPAVAMAADGDFVVVWASFSQVLPDDLTIHGQLYDAGGSPVGGEMLLSEPVEGEDEGWPAVAMDADGDFVVVWETEIDADGDGLVDDFEIDARRFDAAGAPRGGEFDANVETAQAQAAPSAAMSADGHFVLAWDSNGQDGDGYGVFARRFPGEGPPRNHVVTVGDGEVVTGIDFGNSELGDIEGVAWHDQNGNRARDAGEPPLAGWTVFLDDDADGTLDTGERWTLTAADGSYEFLALTPGTYHVAKVLPDAAWTIRYPAGGAHTVVLTAGDTLVCDFGSAVKGDCDGNGKVDFVDLGRLATYYDQSGADWTKGDFSDDGNVNFIDLGILATYYDYVYTPAPTPAPAGAAAAELDDLVDLLAGPSLSVLPAAMI